MIKDSDIKALIQSAIAVKEKSYSPYSHFQVGAALMTNSGKVYTGTNIENASYPVGICAERSAFAAAISNGERDFSALAIVGSSENKELRFCTPCGMCRQTAAEFCSSDFPIILAKSEEEYEIHTIGELLPVTFRL